MAQKRYLRDLKDVRRYLQDIVYRLDTGELEENRAKAMKEILNAITYNFKVEAMIDKVNELSKNNEIMAKLAEQLKGL